MDQLIRTGDTTLFGLANAVTATARETRDPELKWDLEEFGGGIAIGAPQISPPHVSQAAARRAVAMAVG
jgi:hypothetical protein